MDTTSIEIPKDLLATLKLKPEEVQTELVMGFYRQGRITAAQARSLAVGSVRLEELIKQKEQDNRLDMDAFISWAAHDLKSPLNAIIGFTKVVLKGIDGPVNEIQTTDLTSAHGNGLRMLALVNNLIDMARLNNGSLKIEPASGDLLQTLADSANRWKSQNPAKELQTEININAPVFAFDPARLRQIIGGLLTYAANHVAEGGRVILRATDDDRNIFFEFSSSGEKARDKYELDLAMLGFICRGLIGLHGGNLKIGQDTGAGITLSFTLPRN
jgi:signal transduction histidine kinase